MDKLQIINRGTETAFDVVVSLPDDATLQFDEKEPIAKIPGGGRTVTVNVFNYGRMLGGPRKKDVFDVTVKARTEAGDEIVQEVFLDVNS